MKYPEQLFIYCNENDDYSWDCNEGETWTGEVRYILQSEYDTLTATIAQKDAEIELLQTNRRLLNRDNGKLKAEIARLREALNEITKIAGISRVGYKVFCIAMEALEVNDD